MQDEHFNVEKKFIDLRNELVEPQSTERNRNESYISVPCDPSNTRILAVYGWDDDRTNFRNELDTFIDILVPKEYQDKTDIVDGCDRERLGAVLSKPEPFKVIIYFGHGTGNGASFAFDLLGGRLPYPDSEEQLRQRYWFMKDLVRASINKSTERVYVFIGACGSVGSDTVLRSYNEAERRMKSPPPPPLFYIRQCGSEVGENKIIHGEIVHIPESINVSCALVLGTFAQYIKESKQIFPWDMDRINVSYATDYFPVEPEKLLTWQKEIKEFLDFLRNSRGDLLCNIRNFGNNENTPDVQWEAKNKQLHGRYEVHAHFVLKNGSTDIFEMTRIHIKSEPNGLTFLDNKIEKDLVEELMKLLPGDDRTFSIKEYVPK